MTSTHTHMTFGIGKKTSAFCYYHYFPLSCSSVSLRFLFSLFNNIFYGVSAHMLSLYTNKKKVNKKNCRQKPGAKTREKKNETGKLKNVSPSNSFQLRIINIFISFAGLDSVVMCVFHQQSHTEKVKRFHWNWNAKGAELCFSLRKKWKEKNVISINSRCTVWPRCALVWLPPVGSYIFCLVHFAHLKLNYHVMTTKLAKPLSTYSGYMVAALICNQMFSKIQFFSVVFRLHFTDSLASFCDGLFTFQTRKKPLYGHNFISPSVSLYAFSIVYVSGWIFLTVYHH